MAILDTAKDIYDLAKKGLTIELQEKIMSLREEAMELQEENLQLRQRLMEFEELAREKSSVVFSNGFYYKDNQGPFCQVCYDKDQKLCRVVDLDPNRTPEGFPYSKKCNVCNKRYP